MPCVFSLICDNNMPIVLQLQPSEIAKNIIKLIYTSSMTTMSLSIKTNQPHNNSELHTWLAMDWSDINFPIFEYE